MGLICSPSPIPAIKGKLQHLHSRIAGVLQKLMYRGGKKAKIFCNDGPLTNYLLHCTEKVQPRPSFPCTFFGCLSRSRNSIVSIKAPEMIDTKHIIKPKLERNTVQPPVIAICPHLLPIKKRIAPQLAICRKAIRWATSHPGRMQISVHLELIRMCPYIRTVFRHINRNIANDRYPFGLRQTFQPFPLLKKQKLYAFPKENIRFHLCLGL